MTSQPGFFSFRWQPEKPSEGAEDIAVVFKAPGAFDQAVLPDLIEGICVGPVIPSAVVMLQFGDDGLIASLQASSLSDALGRFNGRMPLLVFTVHARDLSVELGMVREASVSLQGALTKHFMPALHWIEAGLAKIFDPKHVVVTAPAGYAFRKPSDDRSTYFVRAELGLSTSASVFFTAFAIFHRLVQAYGKPPTALRLLLVDTMNVASTAFALRDILSLAGLTTLPQVESFHSYGGIDQVKSPLPDTSLCIVSASSSMNLHRKWIQKYALSSRDIITLVTFEDAVDAKHALCALPKDARPDEAAPSSAYDIRIAGEYFFPEIEPPRKVLLTTTHHACKEYTEPFCELRGRMLFSAFKATSESVSRRSLFVDAEVLLGIEEFQKWVNHKIPQLLKAGTTHVIFQDDRASATLARHIAHIAKQLGCQDVTLISAKDVSVDTVARDAPIVCVAAVVGKGNALLSLSRDLRSCHFGARLYVVGAQLTESVAQLETFDKNLKHSATKSPVEVLRSYTFLSNDTITESFLQELALYQTQGAFDERKGNLKRGLDPSSIFLNSGPRLLDPLVLNPDFAFWNSKYPASALHAEVLATISTVLQNARTAKLKDSKWQLRSPLLMHVALDPENFARFNEGIIQAAFLRAALPSELDYRGDAQASSYMAVLLSRTATKFDHPKAATLEFLVALATKRMQLNADDIEQVALEFQKVIKGRSDPLSLAVAFMLSKFASTQSERQAF